MNSFSMILVDSSAWITYFLDNPKAGLIASYFSKASDGILVPSAVLYEVYRCLSRTIGDEKALFFVTQMENEQVVPLDEDLALYAAKLGSEHQLGMADAIIYATAQTYDAELITLDNDFRKLPGCKVFS
ncbi:MAG: type II toxin-antitoxin system VapC family toxin [Deltaproteobacteria bacterium]|nr:type II toxin-antitoxin system VapC family toxin [Deltaproteobacteria bacterium]